MNSLILATVGLAALSGKVSAFPSLYDSVHSGCEIPSQGYKGHGEPAANPDITITVMSGTTEVTEYTPGGEYTIEVPAYSGETNCWIHASAGTMSPSPAASCPEAAFSEPPAATHTFTWTAPATATPVTISVAQAAGAADNYNTATMDLAAGGGASAPATAPGPAADAETPPAPAPAPAEGAEGTESAPTEEGVEGGEASHTGITAATGALAAAAAAVAALAM